MRRNRVRDGKVIIIIIIIINVAVVIIVVVVAMVVIGLYRPEYAGEQRRRQ